MLFSLRFQVVRCGSHGEAADARVRIPRSGPQEVPRLLTWRRTGHSDRQGMLDERGRTVEQEAERRGEKRTRGSRGIFANEGKISGTRTNNIHHLLPPHLLWLHANFISETILLRSSFLSLWVSVSLSLELSSSFLTSCWVACVAVLILCFFASLLLPPADFCSLFYISCWVASVTVISIASCTGISNRRICLSTWWRGGIRIGRNKILGEESCCHPPRRIHIGFLESGWTPFPSLSQGHFKLAVFGLARAFGFLFVFI